MRNILLLLVLSLSVALTACSGGGGGGGGSASAPSNGTGPGGGNGSGPGDDAGGGGDGGSDPDDDDTLPLMVLQAINKADISEGGDTIDLTVQNLDIARVQAVKIAGMDAVSFSMVGGKLRCRLPDGVPQGTQALKLIDTDANETVLDVTVRAQLRLTVQDMNLLNPDVSAAPNHGRVYHKGNGKLYARNGALSRFNADGSLDTDFNVISLGVPLNGGLIWVTDQHIYVNLNANWHHYYRYDLDGNIDAGFELNVSDQNLSYSVGGALNNTSRVYEYGGKIYTVFVSGIANIASPYGDTIELRRFNMDGTADTSWDGDGLLEITRGGLPIAIMPSVIFDGTDMVIGYGYKDSLAQLTSYVQRINLNDASLYTMDLYAQGTEYGATLTSEYSLNNAYVPTLTVPVQLVRSRNEFFMIANGLSKISGIDGSFDNSFAFYPGNIDFTADPSTWLDWSVTEPRGGVMMSIHPTVLNGTHSVGTALYTHVLSDGRRIILQSANSEQGFCAMLLNQDNTPALGSRTELACVEDVDFYLRVKDFVGDESGEMAVIESDDGNTITLLVDGTTTTYSIKLEL